MSPYSKAVRKAETLVVNSLPKVLCKKRHSHTTFSWARERRVRFEATAVAVSFGLL